MSKFSVSKLFTYLENTQNSVYRSIWLIACHIDGFSASDVDSDIPAIVSKINVRKLSYLHSQSIDNARKQSPIAMVGDDKSLKRATEDSLDD